MAKNTVPLSGRVPEPLKEKVEELAEEREMSRSAMTRELIKDGIEEIENEHAAESNPSRSSSSLTIFAVATFVTGSTLLATGHTAAGGVFGAIAALYVLFWATGYDVVVEEVLASARDKLAEVGGVVAFFRNVISGDKNNDPIVVQATRLRTVAEGGLVALVAILIPLGVAAYFGALQPFLAAIGTTGVTAIVLLILVLAYGSALLMTLSALASLAIATSRSQSELVGGAEPDV